MNALDVVLALVLLFGIIKGYRKGLLMELAGLLALVLGLVGGFLFLDWGVSFLTEEVGGLSVWPPFIAFLLIFAAIVLLVHLLGRIMKKVLDKTILGGLDSFAGAVLGLLKWAFALSALLWVMGMANVVIPESALETSFLYPYLVGVAPWAIDVASGLAPFVGDLREVIQAIFEGNTVPDASVTG